MFVNHVLSKIYWNTIFIYFFCVITLEFVVCEIFLNFNIPRLMMLLPSWGYYIPTSYLKWFSTAYHAPLETFMELNRRAVEENFPTDRPINLCVGKEWHRFPSSFFLPGLKWVLRKKHCSLCAVFFSNFVLYIYMSLRP